MNLREFLKEKRVVVIGFGRSGQAAVKLLLKCGARVIVSESKPLDYFSEELINSFVRDGVAFEVGHAEALLSSADLVVVSPGVPKEVYKICIRKDIPVIGELELAWQCLPRELKENTVAITGTNGKTTTTAMCGEMLRLSGYKTFIGGNYGIPLSDLVVKGAKVEKVVLEVSSFQLETIETFSPRIGVLLNITPDHLDRYSSFEEYAYYKYRLFEYQGREDFSILPLREAWFHKYRPLVRGKIIYFAEEPFPGKGAFLKEEKELVIRLDEEEVYDFSSFKLCGMHNRLNCAAAALSARLIGARKEAVSELIDTFVGFSHRMEYIASFAGVDFINDSKATNVDATLKALESLSGSVILIMGGRFKGGKYEVLRPQIKAKVKTLILMGEARERLGEELEGVVETKYAKNLKEAFQLALKASKPGDVILLSPGCASFDEFKNYEERGEAFRRLVLEEAPRFYGEEKSQRVYH